MSVATAAIMALVFLIRSQKGISVSRFRPSPTKTLLLCQSEGIAFKCLGVPTSWLGNLNVAIATSRSVHRKDQPDRFEADGHSLNSSFRKAVSDDVSGAAAGTTDQVVFGLHFQGDIARYKILSNVVGASQAERVIDRTRGHE